MALMIPSVVIVPNLDVVWFFALDSINVGQLIYSAAKRSALEAQSLAVHVKHVRMQALKFGAAEEEIVDLLLEECKLSDQQVENRKIPWRLQDSAFRIGKRLGSGTQANVYAALYQGAPVALKVMTESNCRENLRELAVEASTLWSLQKHPFLLTFFGVSRVMTPDHGRRVCLVFEYCPRTLEDALHSQSDPWVVEPGVVLVHQAKVLRQIASAMACLHHADIQHRDLKPDNVFFGFDGDIRIADFGVANKSTARIEGGAIRGDYGGRNSIEMMGTPGYITPALLRLQNGTSKPGDVCENIDTFNFERHDAFAFVVLGIFVLRGSLPYDDDASSSRLLDPQYVQFCVEAALEADDISPGFRDCLADLYRASSKSSERVDFAAVRDDMFRLPPTSECTMVFNFDQLAQQKEEGQPPRHSHAGSFTMERRRGSSTSLPLMSVGERQASIQMSQLGTI